jgi:multiple sugar transport system permease protein
MRVKQKVIYLYFTPVFLLIMFIYLIPICNTFYNAFFNTSAEGAVTFIGFGNFIRIKSMIGPTIWRTLVWTFGSIVPAIILGFIAALIFQKDFRFKKTLIAACILPYTIPLVIVATVWILMYQIDFGLLNVFLKELKIIHSPISFLSVDNAMTAVIVARIWRSMPFAFLSYYAALRSIPTELYEAGDVDGASGMQKLFYITLPQLREITATTFIILTVWTFLVFDIVFTMTGGGPLDTTSIMSIEIYKELMGMQDLGTSSALSIIAIAVLLCLTLLYWKFFTRGGEQ